MRRLKPESRGRRRVQTYLLSSGDCGSGDWRSGPIAASMPVASRTASWRVGGKWLATRLSAIRQANAGSSRSARYTPAVNPPRMQWRLRSPTYASPLGVVRTRCERSTSQMPQQSFQLGVDAFVGREAVLSPEASRQCPEGEERLVRCAPVAFAPDVEFLEPLQKNVGQRGNPSQRGGIVSGFNGRLDGYPDAMTLDGAADRFDPVALVACGERARVGAGAMVVASGERGRRAALGGVVGRCRRAGSADGGVGRRPEVSGGCGSRGDG